MDTPDFMQYLGKDDVRFAVWRLLCAGDPFFIKSVTWAGPRERAAQHGEFREKSMPLNGNAAA